MSNWLGLDRRPPMTADQRAAYNAVRATERGRVLSHTVATVCGFYLSFTAVDIMILKDVATLSVLLRFGLILPLAVVLMAYLRGPAPIASKEVAALAVSISGNLAWCIILVSSKNSAVLDYYFAAVIFQMVITIAAKTPFGPSFAASIVTFAVNYTFIWFIEGSSTEYVMHHFAVYFSAMVLTLVACHQLEVERLIVFLQAHENERLKSELARQNGELARLSFTDPLTQLANRRGTEAAVREMRERLRPEAVERAALFVIDIDHFKAFNDGYGHAAGDDCLTRVASVLRQECGESIHVGRHGGEEFVAILPDCDAARAGYSAERLRMAIRALSIPHDHRDDAIRRVTVSIGAACGAIGDDEELARLVRTADAALYAAKAGGRDGWRLAETPAERAAAVA